MKSKKKLISLICAFCLVLCLGVFGVLAVTELNLSIGGEIKFSATGVKATIGTGRLVTGTDASALTDYAGVWQTDAVTENKLKGFAVTTQKADYTADLANWSGLKLQFNEAGDSVYLWFTITNNSTDNTELSVEITDNTSSITEENNINTIIVLPTINPIASGATENVFIEFKVESKLIDAVLKGFAINVKLTRSVVTINASGNVTSTTETKHTGVAYEIDSYNGVAYAKPNNPSGDIVIASTVKDSNGKVYPVVSTVYENGFKNNANITSVHIPSTMHTIDSDAFTNCSNLSTITGMEGVMIIISSGLTGTKWYNDHENGLLYLNNCLIGYKGDKPTGALNVAEGTRVIGTNAFSGCTGITSADIPESVVGIGGNAFNGCTSLASITGMEGVLDIRGTSVFTNTKWYNDHAEGILYLNNCIVGYKGSTVLTGELTIAEGTRTMPAMAFSPSYAQFSSVILPSSLEWIGNSAFSTIIWLTSVTISATTPPDSILNGNPFPSSVTSVTVPNGALSAYQNAKYWKTLPLVEAE